MTGVEAARAKLKVTVLAKMASLGWNEDQMTAALHAAADRMEKSAAFDFSLSAMIGNLFNTGAKAFTAGLVAPPILGGIGGLGAGYLVNSADDKDVEEAKAEEIVNELDRLALQAKQRLVAKNYYQQLRSRGRRLL